MEDPSAQRTHVLIPDNQAQRTHVLIPDNRVIQQAHPVSASIPATLVVKSDGSLAISSDAIDTQSNPIQLVMIPNAAGKTNLYMVPKKDNESNQAFLVKPVDGKEWNVDKASFQSTEKNVSIPNSSTNVPKETSASLLSNTMTVDDLLPFVNVAKEGNDMVNVSKTMTVTSSSSTSGCEPPLLPVRYAPNIKTEPVLDSMQARSVTTGTPPLLPVCDAPSVKTEPVWDLTQVQSDIANTTPTGPATANNSTTFATTNLIRALLQHKMAQQANTGSQQADSRPRPANPGSGQTNPGPRQTNPMLQQKQQKTAGSQVVLNTSNIPPLISKLLQQTAASKDAGGQQAQQQTILSQTTAFEASAGQTPATIVNQMQPFTYVQQGNVHLGVQAAQLSNVGSQPIVSQGNVGLGGQTYVGSQPIVAQGNAGFGLVSNVGSQPVIGLYTPVSNSPQQCQPSYPALSQQLTQMPLGGAQPLQYLPLYNLQTMTQPQSVGVVQQNPSPCVTQGQTNSVTALPSLNSFVNIASPQTVTSSIRSQLEVVLGSHNASANVAPLAQHLSTALANNDKIQYKFTYPVTQASDSGSSQTNTVQINPNKNTHDNTVKSVTQTATSASNIASFESKKDSEVFVDVITGLKPASSSVSPTVYMINGQPYLISVNENDNVVALVTLASTKESLNAAPQNSLKASSTTVISCSTPVLSAKESTSNNKSTSINKSTSNNVSKLPLSVLNMLKSSGKSGQLSPINLMGLSSEQLTELNDFMLREHGKVLDRQLLDYINSYTKTQDNAVKECVRKIQNSTMQIKGRPANVREILASTTNKKKSDPEYSKAQWHGRKTCGETELHCSVSNQNVHRENKIKTTGCDNDLDAMIVDSSSSEKREVTTFYSDGTFTGPDLGIPPRSPIGSNDARPMLLFRSDIARKLKPAILRESDIMPISVNKTTSITSPMVFSITTTVSSIVTVSSAVTTRAVSTTSSVSPSNRMNTLQLSSSTVSSNVGKASPISGNRNAGKEPLVLGVESVPSQGHQSTRVPLKTIKMNRLIDLVVSSACTSRASPSANGKLSVIGKPEQAPTQPATKDKKLAVEITYPSSSAIPKRKGDMNVEIIDLETDSNSNNTEEKDSLDDINAPMTIKIDSVFSLNPTGTINSNQDLCEPDNGKRTETHQNDEDQSVLESDESDVEIIDSPEHHDSVNDVIIIDSNEDEITQHVVRAENESLSKDRKEMDFLNTRNKRKCKLTDHSCRVVLRCLNMKKFQPPFSLKCIQQALLQNMCTKKCRKMAVHNYFEKGAATSITRLPTCSDRRYHRYIPYVKVNAKRLESKISKIIQKAMQSNEQINPRSHDSSVKNLKLMSNDATEARVVTTDLPRMHVVAVNDTDDRQHVSQQVLSRLKQKVHTSGETNVCGYSPQCERTVITKALSPGHSQQANAPTAETTLKSTADTSSPTHEKTHAVIVLSPTSVINSTAVSLIYTSPSSSATSSTAPASSLSLTSTAESPTYACKTTTSRMLNNLLPLLDTFESVPLSIETQCAARPDKQFLDIEIEQNDSHLGNNVETDTQPVSVQSEPISDGDYHESQLSPVSGKWITRKRKSSDEISISEDDENRNTVRNDNKVVNILDTSEISHLERIKRLKEQLQQEQEALEKIRKQRFSEDSLTADSETSDMKTEI